MTDRKIRIGKAEVDFDAIVPDSKGLDEEMLATIIEEDWAEAHYLQFGGKLNLFLTRSDLKEWDEFLIDRYAPEYGQSRSVCNDCSWGPCELVGGKGRCGLEMKGYQARLGLRYSCLGCLPQLVHSRDLLEKALSLFGKEKALDMGRNFIVSDHAPNIGILTGIYARNLGDLGDALNYAEREFNKLIRGSYLVLQAMEAESGAFHSGSLLMLCMEVSEIIKMCCFNFTNTGNEKLETLGDFPPAKLNSGPGSVNRNKPVIIFVGDDFLPAWFCVESLKKEGTEEEIEICGIGPAGDDIVRFFPKGHILGPVLSTAELLKSGIADVTVAGEGCLPLELDISVDSDKAKTPFIWTGRQGIGVEDRTGTPVEEMVSLYQALGPIWVRDAEKAGKCAAGIAMKVLQERKNLPLSEQTGKVSGGNWIIRAGRGPTSIAEQLQSAFALMWGNSPGLVMMLGCGNAEKSELGWLAEEFVARNCIVMTAGCAASEIGRHFDDKSGRYIYQRYESAAQARNLINFGGCDAICHPLGFLIRYMRPAGGISSYGNLAEVANGIYQVMPAVLVIWGVGCSERMYCVANALARLGIPVIAGPRSGLNWPRYLKGDPGNYSKWWAYHGGDGARRDVEPVPENLIESVESKEEVLIRAARLFLRPGNFRDARRSILDLNIELSQKYSNEMPEGWHHWIRSDAELPPRSKVRMLRLLREEYGWDTDQRNILKGMHRDGRLLPIKDFVREYGMDQGTYLTNIYSMLPIAVRKKANDDGER
ncbi:MAG: hypothetical protein C4576_32545 [Desulfobacteraceae bacterium]|jgi:CO dehydrogenase/acetyl-CoA synthase alpha subunit|nr:MAG: hypothetical protein C4576_32545 [Desulfobacteraceae bacterium]